MNDPRVLVTGGAGFIGSHLVDRLVAAGRRVRVLDSLDPQAHGDGSVYRNPEAESRVGSVLDPEVVSAALDDAGEVVHLAAQVGVGQSMYELTRYVGENSLGTAVLLEAIADKRDQISSLLVASSMSIYGEGRYACDHCGVDRATTVRAPAALAARVWEPACASCGTAARPLPTDEAKLLESDSIYAITKKDQEELCLVFGRAYGIRTLALRFFNVYGPRQSLSNPYTGVAAIFAGRLLNGRPPLIFEDGGQSRDFVHVSDIARGIELALSSEVSDTAINLGTGSATTVLEVARDLADELGVDIAPDVAGRFRIGDIRHCFADISRARHLLGYEPSVAFRDGLRELVAWIAEAAPPAVDRTVESTAELTQRGLVT
ncbi:MAG: NAD-dependent epimerase/dehydratase family protein [Gaiellaceae bacterium]